MISRSAASNLDLEARYIKKHIVIDLYIFTDTAVVITSRKGKEMLLFRQYTYRKQYDKGMKTRWVCSTLKNCKACIFTDESNYITSSFDEHIHDPPQYYTKPKNILQALREPLILDTD